MNTYQAAIDADNAWQAELERLYGAHASFFRYTERGRGVEGMPLHTLYLDRKAKVDAWRATSGQLSGLQSL